MHLYWTLKPWHMVDEKFKMREILQPSFATLSTVFFCLLLLATVQSDARNPRRPPTEEAFLAMGHHEKAGTSADMETKIGTIKKRRKWDPWDLSNPIVAESLKKTQKAYEQQMSSSVPNALNSNSNVNTTKQQAHQHAVLQTLSTKRGPSRATKLPNILLIVADDLGYGDLSVPPFIHSTSSDYLKNFPCVEGGILTPNLEKMASRGTIMTNFHSASPVCSPSRVAIMTGLYPWRLGAMNAFELGRDLSQRNGFLPQVPTIPEIFREAGYYTAHSGKWHLGGMREECRVDRAYKDNCKRPSPNQHGFEEYTSALDGPESPRYTFLLRESSLHSMGHRHLIKDDVPVPMPPKGTQQHYVLSDREAEDAIKIMKDAKTNEKRVGQPWYIQVWFNAPHGPWEVLPAGEKAYKLKYNVSDYSSMKCTDHEGRTHDLYEGQQWRYKTMVTAMDRSIGKLLDAVKELGEEENTLIVFTSDNGNEMGAGSAGPYKDGKRSLHEGGVRVPAFFQWIGTIPANTQLHTFGATTDLMATFLEAAGLQKPSGLRHDGVSLLSILTGVELDGKKKHHNHHKLEKQGFITHKTNNSTTRSKMITSPLSKDVNASTISISSISDINSVSTNVTKDTVNINTNASLSVNATSHRRRLAATTTTTTATSATMEDYSPLHSRVYLWHKDTDPYSRDQRVQSAGYFEDLKVMSSTNQGCVDRVYDLRHDPYEQRNLVVPNKGCIVRFGSHDLHNMEALIDRNAAKSHCKMLDATACLAKYHRSVITKMQVIMPKLTAFAKYGNQPMIDYMKRDNAFCAVPTIGQVPLINFEHKPGCGRSGECSIPDY